MSVARHYSHIQKVVRLSLSIFTVFFQEHQPPTKNKSSRKDKLLILTLGSEDKTKLVVTNSIIITHETKNLIARYLIYLLIDVKLL